MRSFARGFFFLYVGILITGCSLPKQLPSLPIEKSPERIEQAKNFKALNDRANVYLRLNSGGTFGAKVQIIINDHVLGVIDPNSYINFDVPHGEYHFKLMTTFDEDRPLYAEFDISVFGSSVVLIQCEGLSTYFGGITRSSEPVLQNSSQCSPSEMSSIAGVSYCMKPYENPWTYTPENNDPMSSCALVNDQQVFLDSVLVKANDIQFKGDDERRAYAQAKREHTVGGYQAFIAEYPLNKYGVEIKRFIQDIYKEQALSRDEQVNAVIQRYSALPLQVQKDKVMLILTNHLKREQYKESLLYFLVLERMRVKLSPSFDYFWGEALVKAGQNKEGLKKLYVYINKVGASGQYYSQALALSNEAEQ